ncbi:hypothetical protein C8J56DRAFT_936699, partial [Mycena floridula]
MITLYSLSTIHIILVYSMAFISDKGAAAPYHLFSLRMDRPNLFSDNDPASLTGIATALKVRFALSNAVADAILLHRCYVIWGFNWRVIIPPGFLYLIIIVAGFVDLVHSGKRELVAICLGTMFSTNVYATCLAAGRIWWINRKVRSETKRPRQKLFQALPVILLESGFIYPIAMLIGVTSFFFPTRGIATLISIASCYQLVDIAPTLIIVRVGLGVSTNDMDTQIAYERGRREAKNLCSSFSRGFESKNSKDL